jgi:hypothetical protein
MRRALAVAIGVASLWGALAVYGPAAALAASPSGTLTSPEYKDLSQQFAAVKRTLRSKSVNWKAAEAACRKAGTATPLLRSQRDGCLADLATIQTLVDFGLDEAKCAAAVAQTTTGTTTTGTTTTGTTTTGTTTTGTTTTSGLSTAYLHVVACLNPAYKAISRAATAMYPADVASRKQALARKFAGICLATLVDTPTELRHEENFAFTAKHLAVDAALLTKVGRGQAPASDVSTQQIVDDATDFDTSAKTLLSQSSPQKLSVCSHQ